MEASRAEGGERPLDPERMWSRPPVRSGSHNHFDTPFGSSRAAKKPVNAIRHARQNNRPAEP
jgi:hypothetical protein